MFKERLDSKIVTFMPCLHSLFIEGSVIQMPLETKLNFSHELPLFSLQSYAVAVKYPHCKRCHGSS